MKNLLFLILFVFGFLGLFAQEPPYANFAPTIFPDRVMLTIPGNPATSRAVSWRTEFSNGVSIGEITPVNAGPQLEQDKKSVTGTIAPWEDGSQSSMGHKVISNGLKYPTLSAHFV